MFASVLLAVSFADSGTVTLNNGIEMPRLAFAANVWDAETCKNATLAALETGFRFVWSSALVGSACQAAQAAALAESPVNRSEVFVSGTINTQSCSSHDDCVQKTADGAVEQFNLLGENLDMLMLDYPSSFGCNSIVGQWKALSSVYQQHKVKSVAVSNFGSEELRCLQGASVTPVTNQMRICVSCGDPVPIVNGNQAAGGIIVQAYSPLGSGSLVNDPLLQEIGDAHGKSAAQVALRWILQHNATVATQSTKRANLADDVAIYDFALTDAEMAQLDAHHLRRG